MRIIEAIFVVEIRDVSREGVERGIVDSDDACGRRIRNLIDRPGGAFECLDKDAAARRLAERDRKDRSLYALFSADRPYGIEDDAEIGRANLLEVVSGREVGLFGVSKICSTVSPSNALVPS